MVVCAVKLCRNYTGKNIKPSEDISFHRFPTDEEQKQQWIRAIRRGPGWAPGTHCRVCSVHFTNNDFKISETGRRILHKDAIPTKNLYKEERQNTIGTRSRAKKGRPKRRHVSSTSGLPLLACRACLAADTKLYGIRKHALESTFTDFTEITVTENDGYPQHLCGACFTLVEVFVEFKSRCHRAQDVLDEARERELEITTDYIRSIDRESHNLVETQFTVTKSQSKTPEIDIKEEKEVNLPSPPRDVDCDNSHDSNDDGFDIFDDEKLANLRSDTVKVKNENDSDAHGNDGFAHGNDGFAHGNDGFAHGNDGFAHGNDSIPFGEPLVIHGTVVPKHEIYVEVDNDTKSRKHKKVHRNDAVRKRKFKSEDRYSDKKIKNEKLVKLEDNEDVRRSKPRKTDEDYENFAKDYSVDIVFLTTEEQIAEVLARRDGDNYKNSKFKCEQCFKGFSTEGAFVNHKTKHDPAAGSYECESCKFRFPKRYKLLHHQTQHKNNFACKICGHVTKLASKAMEHYKWHNGVKYPCQFCDRVFCKRTSQFNHMRMRHGSAACDICQEIFSGERGLLTHMQKAHKEAMKSRCEACGVQFHSPEAFARHGDASGGCGGHGKSCAECGENHDSEETLLEHMRTTHWTQIKCDKCDETFENEKLYRMHRLVHKEIRERRPMAVAGAPGAARPRGPGAGKGSGRQKIQKRMCEMCGLTWRSAAALKYHQRVHTGEKPHQCPICSKSFRIQDSLQIHMNTHTGARPFQCPHCPKAFKSRTQNHKHQLVHTKVRRYRCDLCDKTFQTSTCVKTHIRTVHMKIPLPPRARQRHRVDTTQEDMRLQEVRPMEARPPDILRLPPDMYTHVGMKIDGLDVRE